MSTDTKHKEIHIELHQKLDELVADYIHITGKLLNETSLMDFIIWSYEQTSNPTEK